MTDRTIEQMNHNLDQLMAIAADNTRGIAELKNTVATVAGAVEQIGRASCRERVLMPV